MGIIRIAGIIRERVFFEEILYLKSKLGADLNVHVGLFTNRNSSPQDLYMMTLIQVRRFSPAVARGFFFSHIPMRLAAYRVCACLKTTTVLGSMVSSDG